MCFVLFCSNKKRERPTLWDAITAAQPTAWSIFDDVIVKSESAFLPLTHLVTNKLPSPEPFAFISPTWSLTTLWLCLKCSQNSHNSATQAEYGQVLHNGGGYTREVYCQGSYAPTPSPPFGASSPLFLASCCHIFSCSISTFSPEIDVSKVRQ